MVSREAQFRGGWVNPPGTFASGSQVVARECAVCQFTGTDPEFVAVEGTKVLGQLVVTPLDQGSEHSETWCVGCVATAGRADPTALQRFVLNLLVERAHARA